MLRAEVLIVGGGPAGAACAGRLRQAGMDCLVVDSAAFPRLKVCAGWVTPAVWRALGVNPADYPHALTHFDSFQIAIKNLRFTLRTHQYAIRRVEFDDWLLERSGARVIQHTVRQIAQSEGGYLLDGELWGRYLVGAGGTRCPVYAQLFAAQFPRDPGALITAMEEEFFYPDADSRCFLWFLQNGLPGYGWYVPKAGGWLNVGIGGSAQALKQSGVSLRQHWERLVAQLDQMGLVRGHAFKPLGHAYYLRRGVRGWRQGNALLAGDAVGLSTLDMGEGIGAAIRSGILAAESILSGGEYRLGGIPRYSLGSLLFSRFGYDC